MNKTLRYFRSYLVIMSPTVPLMSVLKIYLLLLLYCMQRVIATIGTVFDLPTFAESDDIDFYYLEAPFPYNVPSSIL